MLCVRRINPSLSQELLQLIYSTKGSLQQLGVSQHRRGQPAVPRCPVGLRRSAAAAAQGDLDSETEERLEFCLSELEEKQRGTRGVSLSQPWNMAVM